MIGIGPSLTAEITAFVGAYTNVILIPGPSFAVVCEAGLSATRRDACVVAVGVACGAAALSSAILQAAPVLRAMPILAIAGQIGCAAILLGMGFMILRRSLHGSPRSGLSGAAPSARIRFTTGFVAAATNPVSFASFTTAALAFRPTERGMDCGLIALVIFLMAIGWFNTLALVFSQPFLTVHYGRVARTLGSVMGCVLIVKAVSVLARAL